MPLFEIEKARTVTILVVRHLREQEYYWSRSQGLERRVDCQKELHVGRCHATCVSAETSFGRRG